METISDPTPARTLEALLDREAITDVLTTLFVATDQRDWPAVHACLAPEVLFDMTSVVGGAAQTLTPEQITGAWDQALRPIQAIHHQVSNFQVRLAQDEADASCYGIAYHYLPKASGGSTRVFVGTYDFRVRRIGRQWVVTAFRFNVKFIDGNLQLEQSE
jgi:hypothetical protein